MSIPDLPPAPLKWENQPSTATPFDAEVLNPWGDAVMAGAAASQHYAQIAQQAAQDAQAPTDQAIATALTTSGSAAREALDAKLAGIAVTAEQFGAVGDGQVDDTAALQALLEHLGTNGGTGLLTGRYRTTDALNMLVTNGTIPERGFTLAGTSPDTAILLDTDQATDPPNIMRIEWPTGVILRDFTLQATDQPAGHGLSISAAIDTTVENVTVRHYRNSGIIFHEGSLVRQNRNNHVVRCNVHGEGVANNGILLVSSRDSTIEHSNVYDLDPAGAPSYGLQFKNDCINCTMVGGIVDGARVGVAFGSDDDTQNIGHTVTGVRVRNVAQNAFLASKTLDSTVDLQADMATGSYAVSLTLDCAGLDVTAAVDNTSTIPANLATNDCTVTLTRVSTTTPDLPLARFRDGVTTSVLRTTRAPGDAPVQVDAGGAARVQHLATEDTGWIDMDLVNGWTVAADMTPQYRIVGGVCYTRGRVTGGTGGPFTTLPPEARPSQTFTALVADGSFSNESYTTLSYSDTGTISAREGAAPNLGEKFLVG